jgi:MFS family permease
MGGRLAGWDGLVDLDVVWGAGESRAMSRTSPKPAGARLGPEYGKLWTATAISTLGDGMYLAGLPLLAARLTSDPLAVSAVTFAAWLPWLLVALASGALVDRWDRRRVLWTADAGRGVLVGTLAVVVLAGWASIWLLATVGFLLGVGQTLFDSAVLAIIPALVSRDRGRLERAQRPLGRGDDRRGATGRPAGGVVGLAPSAWVAAAALAADGLVGAIWNVAQLSLRQVLIPDRLLGRVIGAFRLVGFGSAPVGALLGGVLGRTLGRRSPFVVGAVVLAVVALLALPAVDTRSVEAARLQAHAADGPA